MRKFLTAEWRDLILANYEVDPALLASRVPTGTDLDLHEGRCFVSLVGFMFLNTRVLGIPIPGHINFEEVNLRFYVKREMSSEVRRGVCFIKELVPKPAIAFIARELFGEPYETAVMHNFIDAGKVSYRFGKVPSADARTITLSLASCPLTVPVRDGQRTPKISRARSISTIRTSTTSACS